MNKISAVVSVYNEERNIERCLKSLAFADEIIVVDNDSTDKTSELARRYTNKIFAQKNDPTKIDLQKNFGFEKATGDWILSVDADEEISPELAQEIKSEIKSKKSEINGYYVPRKNIIFGKWIQHSGWYPDFQLRLFRKGKGKFTKVHVHEPLSLDGKAGYLKNVLIHHNYESVYQFLQRAINVYIPNEAKNYIDKGYVFDWKDAIKFPVNEFLNRFFAREGYKDGFHGLILSLLMGFYHFAVFVYIWEELKFKEVEGDNLLTETKEEIKKSYRDLSFWFSKEIVKNEKNRIKKLIHKLTGKVL